MMPAHSPRSLDSVQNVFLFLVSMLVAPYVAVLSFLVW